MRIFFLQSGGFAGVIRGVRLDAAELGAGDRAELERLVADCGLDGSCERFTAGGRDRRRYDLAIDRGGRIDRLTCDDGSVPDAVRPLVAFMAARATPQGPDFSLPAGSADAGWGRFEGRVVARWEDDGRTMTLVEPFAYVDSRAARWPAPAGAVIDGASIPRVFWSLIGGPFTGEFRNASVVHDAACEARDRAWQAVHRMFYEACRCGGVGVVKAKTMYYAVFHYGPRWRIEERASVVAGATRVERVMHDETPAAASEADAAAIARYFETNVVAADDIPTLAIPGRKE